MSGPPSKGIELKVGLFVVAALLVGGVLIFIVGNQRNVFRTKTAYYSVFHNVSGLRAGMPVRIAGVDVGTIGKVELRNNGRIYVAVNIVDAYAPLVRRGGLATIGSKGMLGDKLLDVSVGTGPPIPPGGQITSSEPKDIFTTLQETGGSAQEVLENLRTGTEALRDPQFGRDVVALTRNLEQVTGMLATGHGTVQRLMTDEQLAGRLDHTLTQLDVATTELARTSRSFRGIADEVRTGNGSAHELVYGESGTQLMRNLADASSELAQMLREIRTGDGTLHDVIYEHEAQELIANLTAASADLRTITADIRAGRGTIGGLLVDPSIYEDVKRLIGDLERNEILRALVRYSIRQDAPRRPPVVTPAPAGD